VGFLVDDRTVFGFPDGLKESFENSLMLTFEKVPVYMCVHTINAADSEDNSINLWSDGKFSFGTRSEGRVWIHFGFKLDYQILRICIKMLPCRERILNKRKMHPNLY